MFPLSSRSVRLVLCGLSALYWELLLIRWQGSCIRIVAYYSNFILIAAFFGLGAGALLARRGDLRLERFLCLSLLVCVLLGVALARFAHTNPGTADEFIWIGAPRGVVSAGEAMGRVLSYLPFWLLLAVVYVADAAAFLVFGQWMGRLFRGLPPIQGYALEISGSILGILVFAALSAFRAGPVVWLLVGFAVVVAALERSKDGDTLAAVCAAITLAITAPFASQFVWSPYYKIEVEPLLSVEGPTAGTAVKFDRPIGYTLEVNNDYHQMMLDLRSSPTEPEFVKSWRQLYDLPYRNASHLPPGPILIVGAGTGNDVSAALRSTDRRVDAVEIDPVILSLGRRLHFERPYQNPRVRVVIDDARSFFQASREKYALVVFGFLDSHTLLSSFSSLRLDNFVYTSEALEAVKERLLPGGEVYLTFATNTPWIHDRLLFLMDRTFDASTASMRSASTYANGIVYRNGKSAGPPAPRPPAAAPSGVEVPTDDWPFLYLKSRSVPAHYRVFIAIVLALGFGAMALLPRGQRRLRFPYFFMGAAFFLVETSNVVRLSLLYGSTWKVNVVVFAGILVLVLAGTLASLRLPRKAPLDLFFGFLLVSLLVAYAAPTSALLAIGNPLLRAVAAVAVFLGPVAFASVIFAALIRDEPSLSEAYGSNVLGAVVGGACEYLSLVTGFRFLLLLTIGFYAIVYALVKRSAAA